MFILLVFGFLAGVATVLSPCILPILPIMLSGVVGGRSRPYGILLGFVLSFATFTVFATALVKSLGLDLNLLRYIASGVLVLMGLTLLFPKLQYKLNSLIKLPQTNNDHSGFWGGFFTGATLGLIWAPCAGPILAAVITLAVTSQIGLGSFLIVISYALGTGVVMLIIILASRQVLDRIKGLYKYLDKIHSIFGILIIIAGLGIATGYDRKVQTYLVDVTPEGWTSFLQSFEENESVLEAIDKLNKEDNPMNLDSGDIISAPELIGINAWINSEPLSLEELKGKVVLVDFWTYSCINCIRTLPYLKDWHEKYQDDGLVIIGVHAPEFAFEKDFDNVKGAVEDYGLEYPIALDNDFRTWRAYNNRYWPAKYFIDRQGNIRHYHFGEGAYQESENIIRQLLAESGQKPDDDLSEAIDVSYNSNQSPETYLGYARMKNFANFNQMEKDSLVNYQYRDDLTSNQWTISGDWIIKSESIESNNNSARLKIKFNSQDVFLVIGGENNNSEIKLFLNGQALVGQQKGDDIDEMGNLNIDGYRLYNLVKNNNFIEGGILELEVPKGVELFAFTFGS